jgi:hypothetical protein
MIGIGVSVLVAASLLVVGIAAFNAGQRHREVVEVVSAGEPAGQAVLVPVGAWRGGWHGGPGFVVFPLVVIGLILLFSARRRGGWGGPGRWSGYGPDDDRQLQDWHRRAHADGRSARRERWQVRSAMIGT